MTEHIALEPPQSVIKNWRITANDPPPTVQPVIYGIPDNITGKIKIGLAYWTVSKCWNPDIYSEKNKTGFTYWTPIPRFDAL